MTTPVGVVLYDPWVKDTPLHCITDRTFGPNGGRFRGVPLYNIEAMAACYMHCLDPFIKISISSCTPLIADQFKNKVTLL